MATAVDLILNLLSTSPTPGHDGEEGIRGGGMGPDGRENNGLRVSDVWEIETAESALLFHEMTKIKHSWKNSSERFITFCFFLSVRHIPGLCPTWLKSIRSMSAGY